MFKFIKKHSWILTCFLALVLIPQSLTLQSKLEGRLIITGLAIDKIGEEYQITCQAVSPSSGLISGSDAAGIDFITVTATTIREGITKIAATTTKSPGLGHLNFVVLGESLFNEDLTSITDFIVRDSHTDTSVLLLIAKNANEQIKKTQSLELGSAIQLRKAFLSRHNTNSGTMTIANKFLSSKFDPSSSSAISYLEIEEEPSQNSNENELTQNNGQSLMQTNEQQSSSEKPIKQGRLKNTLPIALFRDGRFRKVLSSKDEIFGYNMLCGSSKNYISGFDGITQQNGTKAKITLLSKSKKSKISVEIKDNVPNISVNINFSKNEILELIPEENCLDNYKTQQNYLTGEMRQQIEEQIKTKALLAYNAAAENGIDILEAATRLQKYHKKQYDNYFSNHTLDDFLSEAKISITANVSSESK